MNRAHARQPQSRLRSGQLNPFGILIKQHAGDRAAVRDIDADCASRIGQCEDARQIWIAQDILIGRCLSPRHLREQLHDDSHQC